MSREFDEVVADSMARFTEDVDLPSGLAARARSHVRRQRRARIGWAASGTTVAAVAAVLVGTLSAGAPALTAAKGGPAPAHSTHHGRHGGVTIQTTAVVVSRVDRALTKAAAGKPVAFTRQTMQGVHLVTLIPHGKPIMVQGNVMETWSRGPLQNSEMVTRAGKVTFGLHTDVSSGKSVETTISYPQQVWWRGTYDAPTAVKPKFACTLGDQNLTPAQWTREVRKLLSCGAAVAGFDQVDGVKTIKLKLSSTYKRACVATSGQRKCTPQPVGWTGVLWASAASFLPVRLVSHGHHYSSTTDFRWLAPTSANLAKLRLTIPGGFKRV